MKPAQFEYHRPHSVEAAIALLGQFGDDAKILAGGQSLIPLLNLRLARPKHLIDINRISDLNYIRVEDDQLLIGALTRHDQVERSSDVRELCPLLAEAIPYIGHVAIRSRGTIGGSIVHADPAAELPLVLATLDGSIGIRNPEETRYVKYDEFFVTYLTTMIGSDELVTEIRFPILRGAWGTSFQEVSRRHGDFALVAAAAVMKLDESGRVQDVRLGLGGVDGVPFLSANVPQALMNQIPDEQLLREASQTVFDEVSPESDLHASETYRREVAVALSRRVLTEAYARAQSARNRGE